MSFIQAYKEAFTRCYPEKSVVVKPKRVRGEILYAVVINQDKGDILLTEKDVREATRLFNAGK